MPRGTEQLVVYDLSRRRRVYRGYGQGFVGGGAVGSIPVASGASIPGDTRSPASEPRTATLRGYGGLNYAGYFGDDAFREGGVAVSPEAASISAMVATGEGLTIWKSVGAGVLVWVLTKAIDRFLFRD